MHYYWTDHKDLFQGAPYRSLGKKIRVSEESRKRVLVYESTVLREYIIMLTYSEQQIKTVLWLCLDIASHQYRTVNDSEEWSNETGQRRDPILNSAVVSASARKLKEDVKTFYNDEEAFLTIKHSNVRHFVLKTL